MCKEKFIKALNRAVFPGLQGGPHMHTIAAKAVAFREALQPEFKEYAKQIVRNARALSSALQEEGLEIVSGGTDSHLLVIDVRPADITGKEAAECLERVGITANMNTIPYDPQPPRVCSGVRLGTPALTTRGMGELEMARIAKFISLAIQSRDDGAKQKKLREDVREFSRAFPLYSHRLVSGEG